MQRGILEKICKAVMWWEQEGCWDDLHMNSMALLICLLGPGDVPEALDDFMKHDACTIAVCASLQGLVLHHDDPSMLKAK